MALHHLSYITRNGIAEPGVYLDAAEARETAAEANLADSRGHYVACPVYGSVPACVDYVQRLQRDQLAALRRAAKNAGR